MDKLDEKMTEKITTIYWNAWKNLQAKFTALQQA